MNKILAQMMIHCREKVSDAQVETLQLHKDTPADIDEKQVELLSLLNFDINRYKVDERLSKEKQEGPVEMSQSEATMQTIVEVSEYA